MGQKRSYKIYTKEFKEVAANRTTRFKPVHLR